VALSQNSLAVCLDALGRTPEALSNYQGAIAMFGRLAKAQPGNYAVRLDMAKSLQQVGDLLARTSTTNAAAESYEAGLQLAESVLEASPTNNQAKKGRQSLRLRLGLDTAEVVIVEIAPGSQAEQLGLQKGDVLLVYGARHIASTDHLASLIRAMPGLELEVRRAGQPLKFAVREGKLGITTADRNISQSGGSTPK
jgi:S1-C subfamily serine protease